jgi:16S rRNA (guanine527-N7)-methyltransferase
MNNRSKELYDLLDQGLLGLQLTLTETQKASLIAYMYLLMKWSRAFNLTAIKDPYRIVSHHILDSLSIVPYVQGPLIIDVGSGAGLPGIPCALVLPEQKFVLLDSNGKKTRFMTQAVGELQIPNVNIVQSRVEDYHPTFCFNTLMARAFAPVEEVLALTKHLPCAHGQLLLMKGNYPSAELQKIGNDVKVTKLSISGVQEERHLVCIKGPFNE